MEKQPAWMGFHSCSDTELSKAAFASASKTISDLLPIMSKEQADAMTLRGGIIGAMFLTPSTPTSASPWYMEGQHALGVAKAVPLPFLQCKGGALSFFKPTVDLSKIVDIKPAPAHYIEPAPATEPERFSLRDRIKWNCKLNAIWRVLVDEHSERFAKIRTFKTAKNGGWTEKWVDPKTLTDWRPPSITTVEQ